MIAYRTTKKKKRQGRSIYNNEQLKILNDQYEKSKYIQSPERLAKETGLTRDKVLKWFDNKRYNEKRK